MEADKANLARIYRETINRLEIFSRRVQENRDVPAASEFCRWLLFSGILMLLESESNDLRFPNPLKIDGKFLRHQCEELLAVCNARFASNDQSPKFDATSYQTLHDKLDRVAFYLSKLSVAPSVVVQPSMVELEKISCGADRTAANLVAGSSVPFTRGGADYKKSVDVN